MLNITPEKKFRSHLDCSNFSYDPPTIPGIFMHQARRYGDRILKICKKNGRWVSTSWNEALDGLQVSVMGLLSLMLKKAETVGICSRTRAEWADADLAILAAGGVVIGIYPTASRWEMTHVILHSESRICFVENDELLEKILAIRTETGLPKQIILFETSRLSLPQGVISFAGFKELGRKLDMQDPGRFEATWRSVHPDDLATIAYTSGTTGPPKGTMITHANLYHTVLNASSVHRYEESDLGIAFLPLTHMLQRMSVYAVLHLGIQGAYAESVDKLVENFQELRPKVQVSVPQIFERIYNRIQEKLAMGSAIRRWIFNWAMSVGYKTSPYRKDKRPLPPLLAWQNTIAQRLVFRKIQDVFGGQVKYLLCGGAPMPLDLLEFFYAAGLLILEGYGLTETVAPVAVNRSDNFKFGTVGQLIPGMEGKLAEDGELLLRGKGLFSGYYKDPEATAAAIDAQGWFHTGDIAEIDEEGFIKITDRKKDIIITSGGKNISPQNIESRIHALPLISHVMLYGDRRKYLTALITLNPQELRELAKKKDIPYESIEKITGHPRVYEIVQNHLDTVNQKLAPYETIKRFAILDGEFTEEDGELTPTLKIRRHEITRKYQKLIDSLYDEKAK